MNPTATTVGTYLRDLPPDRRVAMARVCSMIRRSARGVRESMRYGLAFYELDGPLFALESGRRHMSLYVAEQEVVIKHKESLPGVNTARSFVKFSDLNRLPLDVVEKIVRDSVAARRTRATQGLLPTQAELLKLWAIKEEAAQVPIPVAKSAPGGKAPATRNGLSKSAGGPASEPKPLRVPAKASSRTLSKTATKTPVRAPAKKSSAASKAAAAKR
jgi:uncharacterized protein YdhG (YjbR/CyaY superfamily)